jgi:DNA-binding XRE family transcriptional regulator
LDDLSPEQRARIESIRARRRTPEAQEEIERVRRQFADHPSRAELIRRGDIDPERTLTGEGRSALIRALAELKRLRSTRGLSLADVAERSGLDRAAISRLETGKNPNPTFETVARYAQALGVRVRVVLEEG